MAIKMYKKSELNFKNGMLATADGDVIVPDPKVVAQANQLETMAQRGAWLKEQPEMCAGPDFSKFERKSIKDEEINKFVCETPLLDKKAEESIALMDELDALEVCDKLNEVQSQFKELFAWVGDDTVLSDDSRALSTFDTPTLGNPLEWDKDDVQNFIAEAHGMESQETVDFTVSCVSE